MCLDQYLIFDHGYDQKLQNSFWMDLNVGSSAWPMLGTKSHNILDSAASLLDIFYVSCMSPNFMDVKC